MTEKAEREERERVNRQIEIEHDRLAKIEVDKAEVVRQEALKPDREKLEGFVDFLSNMDYPEVNSNKAKQAIVNVIVR